MRSERNLNAFLSDESGAVSADWVVLTGAIVGLGLVMLNAVGPAASDITKNVENRYSTPRITVEGAGGEEGGLTGSTGTSEGVTVVETL